MVVSLAQKRQRLYPAFHLQKRLAVFQRQNVVRLFQDLPIQSDRFQRPLSCRRIACTGIQNLAQRPVIACCAHRLRRGENCLSVSALAAEGKRIDYAELRENLHAAACKALRRAERLRHRQLQHKIRACQNCRLRAHTLFKNRRFSALDKASAHQTHDGSICAQRLPDLPQLLFVPPVKGIVFANNASDVHAIASGFKKIVKSPCFPLAFNV